VLPCRVEGGIRVITNGMWGALLLRMILGVVEDVHSQLPRAVGLKATAGGALSFTPETRHLLRSSLRRIADRDAATGDVPDVLRRVLLENRELSADQVMVALHATWREVQEPPGRCSDVASRRYHALMAQCLAMYYGEDLVGLP
jgi:hypothetical protein